MGHNKIREITTSFDEIYNFIKSQPSSSLCNIYTTGGVPFECEAKITKDSRRFILLPHGNRIYEADWGYYFNDMGKDGQRIGQYSISINNEFTQQGKA
jgi:hypothetical protein